MQPEQQRRTGLYRKLIIHTEYDKAKACHFNTE